MCVVGAINNYTDQLYTYGDSPKSSSCKCHAVRNHMTLSKHNIAKEF